MDGAMPGWQPGLRDSDGVRLSVFPKSRPPPPRPVLFFPPLRARAARSRAARLDLASDPPALRDLYPAQVIARLPVHPRLRPPVEVAGEPHGCIGGKAPPPPQEMGV